MKKNTLLVVIALLILGLVGVSIVAVSSKKKLNELTVTYDDLKRQFDAQVIELEKLRSDNKTLESKLADRDAQIEKLKAQIAALIFKNEISVKKIVTLTRQIASLDSEIERYKRRIAELEAEVLALKQENGELTDKNRVLSEEKEVLVGKVTKASSVKAVDLKPMFYKKTLFGKLKLTRKASRVSKVSMFFFLQKNFLAEDGSRVLYVSIKRPNGKVLVDKELASSSEPVDGPDGQQINIDYTIKVNVNYVKDVDNKVSFQFIPDEELVKGSYEVIVYDNSGNIISEKSGFSFQLSDKEGL